MELSKFFRLAAKASASQAGIGVATLVTSQVALTAYDNLFSRVEKNIATSTSKPAEKKTGPRS